MKVEILSGSPRLNSVTKRVALHLLNVLAGEKNLNVRIIDMLDYHLPPVQKVWTQPDDAPAGFREVAQRIFEADAFVLVSPEYNGSYSPALKNFLDHFPKQDRKVFGIVTASPGSLGGIRAAMQLQNLIFGLSGIGASRMLIIPEVDKKLDGSGKLLDADFRSAIQSFKDEFIWLACAVHYASLLHTIKLVA